MSNNTIDTTINKTSQEIKDEILFKCILKGEKQIDVAKQVGTSRQYINQVVKPYQDRLLSNDEVKVVKANYHRILWSANASLLLDMTDPQKREGASLNNTAYAQNNLNNQIRLEEDKSTSNLDIKAATSDLTDLINKFSK